MFLHLAVEIDVQGSRLWGEFVPSPQSLHQCAFVWPIWRVPNFTSTVYVEKIPIEAADKAIIDGAWADGWCEAANFPWGGTSVNFLSLASGFSDSTVRLWNPPELFRERPLTWERRSGWESGPAPKVPPLLPLPWCTWVNVCARVGAPEYIPKKSSPWLSRGSVVSEGAEDPLRLEWRYGILF